jgi:hypothetical protein
LIRLPPQRRRFWLVLGFLLCAAPVGFAAAWLTPMSQPPDEATHTARAAGLLHGAVLATRRWALDPYTGSYAWEAGVQASVPLVAVSLARTAHGPLAGETKPARLNLRRRFFYYLPNTAMYFPAAYVPAALGIALAAALHGSAQVGFLAARLGGLVAYLALGATALGIAAAGEALLLAVLLLPMPLLLAGAVTQDSVLIATTGFAVAALTRREASWRLAGLAGLTLLALAKPPYAPLILLYTLPLGAPGGARRAAAAACALAIVGGWAALTATQVMVPFDAFAPYSTHLIFYHPGPLYTGDPAAWFDQTDPSAQFAGLRAHPAAFAGVVLRAMAAWRPGTFAELVGFVGRAPLPLGWWLGPAWLAAGLAAALGGRRCPPGAGLAALLILASLYAILLSLYLDNSLVGVTVTQGFNARYLLPLLPCLALALPGGRRAPWWSLAPACALGLFDMVYLPVLMMRTYGG